MMHTGTRSVLQSNKISTDNQCVLQLHLMHTWTRYVLQLNMISTDNRCVL